MKLYQRCVKLYMVNFFLHGEYLHSLKNYGSKDALPWIPFKVLPLAGTHSAHRLPLSAAVLEVLSPGCLYQVC